MPALSASALNQTSDPAQFVLSFRHDVTVLLALTAVNTVERRERFTALVDQGLDFDVIGGRLLGSRWGQATPADRQAFAQSFRDYLIQNFAMQATGLDDGEPIVADVRQDGDTVLVITQAKAATRVSMAWRVVQTSAGWRLCDIAVNSVSVASIMRSQFDSILQDAQSGLGPLLRLLHDKSLG